MEEDIKILKKFINTVKGKDYNEENGWHGYYDDELIALGKSLENFLTSYKQLEEENKELNRKLKVKTGDMEYLQNKINKHFISDVEIKAKIEELENLKTQLPVEHMKQSQIQILEELLREE